MIRIGVIAAKTAWVACAVAVPLIVLVDVESVLVTGSIVFLSGIISFWCGWRRYTRLTCLAVANCGIVLLFVALVNLFGWGPPDAEIPFALMGTAFAAMTLPAIISVARNVPIQDPRVCATCGYLLYALVTPRCPECGTEFNASLLTTDQRGELADQRRSNRQ